MSKTPNYFAGKTIIITGAASGIGRATALIFAREVANVVCADINEKGADETAGEVNRRGSRALAIKVDVNLLRRLRIYDCGHGLCERRRRMALITGSLKASTQPIRLLEGNFGKASKFA